MGGVGVPEICAQGEVRVGFISWFGLSRSWE